MAITVINPSVTKILLDLGIDPIDPYDPDNAEQTYMSAVREGINTIESATKGKGDRRTRILREEFQGLLKKKKGKGVVNVAKLLVKKSVVPTNKIRPQALLPPSEKKGVGESSDRIGSVLNDILEVLRKDIKLDKRELADARKERSRQKRIKAEKALESLKSGVGTTARAAMKVVNTLTSPFKEIIDVVVNFIKYTVIGALINNAFSWFGKEENKEKIVNLGRFFKDWWPTLLGGFLLFFTPLGGLVSTVAGIVTMALPTLTALLSNPFFATLIGGGLLAAYLGTKKNKTNQNVDESLEERGSSATVSALKDERQQKNEKGNMLSNFFRGTVMGENAEYEKQIKKAERFNQGGEVPGSGDTDSVLSLLTPGEFVMSKSAVSNFGLGTLAAMNAAGGGTNDGGPFMFEGGGLIGDLSSMRENIQTQTKFLPVKASGMVPVSTPIKVRSSSNTIVLPEIKRQSGTLKVREGSTVPVFDILADSPSRTAVVVALGIEDMV